MKSILAILAGVSLSLAGRTDGHGGLTPEQLAQMRHVDEVAASPDGRYVAYSLQIFPDLAQEENGPARKELHVVDRKGRSRPFVTGEVSVGGLSWTPDSRSVTYLARRGDDENASLYSIPVDGGESEKLLEHETPIAAYQWSTEPGRLLFLASRKEEEDGGAADKGFDAEIYEEELSPGQVWIAERKDGEWESRLLEVEGSVAGARWSPDGGRLALSVAPTPLIDDFYMHRRFHIVDAGSGERIALVDHRGKQGPFRWSPDGRRLAFIGGAHMNDPSAGRLFLADAGDGSVRRLLEDYLPDFSGLEWLDDGHLLYFSDDGCRTDYGRIALEGPERESYGFGVPLVAESMSLVPGSSRLALAGSLPGHGTEVYWASLARQRMRRLTDSNPWMEGVELARQEAISYTARDGTEVEGVLLYPLGYQEGRRYPLIQVVHGGPEARVPNGWVTSYSRPGQIAAGRGYLVFYPNYRGSTGRGIGFAMSHQSDYAGKEFDDLVDAIDHLDRAGLADPSKVGVTGGSYGGYASAWCATRYSERFAASVMFVGVSDLISKQGTTDIPYEMYLVHARKWPWEDWNFFLERSPIFHAEKARTPLLILHGKEDTRVHPSQSMELYRYLRTLGQAPVRLVWYPGEGHGNSKAAARYDYSLRLMRWMDHYLKGPGGDPPPHRLDHPFLGEEK